MDVRYRSSQPLGVASGAVVLPLPGFLREAASADG